MNEKMKKEIRIGNGARDLLLSQQESYVEWFKGYGIIHYCGEHYKVIPLTRDEIMKRINRVSEIIEPYCKVPWFIKIYRKFKK